MGTFNVVIYGFVIFVIAMVFVVRRWKQISKREILVEVIRSGGDSVKVMGKLVGNMLEISPNKKYGFEVGKMYPFVADKEDGEKETKSDKAKEGEARNVGVKLQRGGIFYSNYPEGLPSFMTVGIRKCIVDEDNWEMRTRKGSDPMMNPDLLVLHEHEKTSGMLAAMSQTIEMYENKLQKAYSRSLNPMILYALVALMVCGVGYLIYQQQPLIKELELAVEQINNLTTMVEGIFK